MLVGIRNSYKLPWVFEVLVHGHLEGEDSNMCFVSILVASYLKFPLLWVIS